MLFDSDIVMNQHLQLINRVYSKRKAILLANCPQTTRGSFQKTELLQKVEKLINLIPNFELSLQQFFAYLIVQLTRSMEGYSYNTNQMKRFENIYESSAQHSYRWKVLAIQSELQDLVKRETQLHSFIKNDTFTKAITNLKLNKQLISQIVMQDILDRDIDQYMAEVKIIIVSYEQSWYCIFALSTYDGKHIYLKNDEEVYDDHKHIEQAIVDGFYFWLIKNQNPFLIMAEINPILISHSDNRQSEAGDYYLEKVYGERFCNPMPFRMIRFKTI